MLFAEAVSQAAKWEIPWYWAALAGPVLPFIMVGIIRIVWVTEWYVRVVGGTTQQTANYCGAAVGLLAGAMLGAGAVAATGLMCVWAHGPELPDELLKWGALTGLLIALLSLTYWYLESKPPPINPPESN